MSLDQQELEIRQHCEREGWEIAGIYREEGVSGSSLQRQAFEGMMERARTLAENVYAIVVHSLSRGFRDLLGQETIVRELSGRGIKFVSVKENISDDPTGVFLRTLLGLQNEMKVHDSRIGTMRGMTANAAAGFSNGGNIPFGYRSVDDIIIGAKQKKRLEIDPVEAETVRLIFKLANEGDGTSGPIGVKKIATYLNDKGLRSRKGNPFGTGTVHEILVREAYTGTKSWNVFGPNGQQKPDREIVDIAIPAIIDPETYDHVQALLQSREPIAKGPRLEAAPSLFGGMIRCGLCQGAMSPVTGTSRTGTIYTYYKCSAVVKKGTAGCEGISISRPKAENMVMDALCDQLVTPARILGILEAIQSRRASRRLSVDRRIAGLQIEAANAERAVKNLYTGVLAGAIDASEPTFAAVIKEAVAKRDLIKATLERAASSATDHVDIDTAAVETFAAALQARLKTGDTAARKKWLTSIVDEIVVTKDKIRVIGRNDNFEKAVKNTGSGQTPVRSSVQVSWCPGRNRIWCLTN